MRNKKTRLYQWIRCATTLFSHLFLKFTYVFISLFGKSLTLCFEVVSRFTRRWKYKESFKAAINATHSSNKTTQNFFIHRINILLNYIPETKVRLSIVINKPFISLIDIEEYSKTDLPRSKKKKIIELTQNN